MITIALRFSNNFAPEEGTILAHQQMIERAGYVYYGKLGAPLYVKMINQLMDNTDKRILLIHSGGYNRYWAHYTDVTREQPRLDDIPSYYRDRAGDFRTWFKIVKFEKAPKNIMSHCYVNSSRALRLFLCKLAD